LTKKQVVIVGGGYGGVAAASRLERRLPPDQVDVTLVSSSQSLLLTPLLSLSASGITDPKNAAVPLQQLLDGTRIVQGSVSAVDLATGELKSTSPSGFVRTLHWDRLLLAPGSVTRPSIAPGAARMAFGAKTLADAVALRNHVVQQLSIAAAAGSVAERQRRLTFVVVGAGYSGTEFVAQMQAMTKRAIVDFPELSVDDLRWVLVHRSSRVLSQLPERLAVEALNVLRRRGVEVRLGMTVADASPGAVRLSNGEVLASDTLIWTAGIRAQQWVNELNLPLDDQGRIVVDHRLAVLGHPRVFAVGDAARVPDLAGEGRPAPPTATHAKSQGRTAADNIAASLGFGHVRAHSHRDRNLVVNLGDRRGLAQLSGLSVTGPAGWMAAYSHRVAALPSGSRRRRVALDWALDMVRGTT
jgi:NADH dehydrogenase